MEAIIHPRVPDTEQVKIYADLMGNHEKQRIKSLYDNRLNYDTAIFAFMEEIGAAKGNKNIINELFTRTKVDEPAIAITGMSARGDLKQHTSTRNYSDAAEYYTKTQEFTEFSDTAAFGRKFLDDNKLLDMRTQAGALMNSAIRTQENFAAAVFSNADQTSFAKDGSTYTWTLCADGDPFVDDTHASKSGSASSQDNKTTNQLDGDNLNTGIVAMGQYTDDAGNQGAYFGDTLVVGLELAKTALELANSDKKPAVANNDCNVYEGMFKVIVWNRLRKQASKTYAPWFWVDSVAAKENLYFLDRILPETSDNRNWQTMVWEIGIYARFAIAIYGWQFCYGGIPA